MTSRNNTELWYPLLGGLPGYFGEIFLACLPADRNPCMSVTDAPLLLTRVCSSWRSIAHSTPRLWAAIHIVLPLYRAMQYPSPGSISHIEETVCLRMDNITASAKQWLDRSGACPLSISIYQGQEWESNSSDFEDLMKKVRRLQITFIIDVVVPYHQRWYDLDVCLPADALYNLLNINVLKTECLKALQKLHVTRQFSATQGSRVTKGLTDILCFFTSHVTAATFWELNLELSYNSGSYVNPVDFATVIIGQCQFLKILKLNMLSNYMFGDGPGTGAPVWVKEISHFLI
ncbi:hypothetical protein BDQ17DRAFT_175652 [Cyathus striatus]|nr:hypothetical protein BDQ17DRAFT_175652 [Cyathus striatus]